MSTISMLYAIVLLAFITPFIAGSLIVNSIIVDLTSLATFFSGYPADRGPLCYECKNLADPSTCHTIAFCNHNEVCLLSSM